MGSIKHVHTLVFYEMRGNGAYYKCADPHCTFYASRKLIIDKASLCSKCRSTEIILDWKALRNKRPLCLNCANTALAKDYRRAKDLMSNVLQRKAQEVTPQ